jgi:regulator of sigma E protease
MELIGLIPSFGGLIYTLIAFVVALSIIVFIHEYGHYIVGRWSGIHAEVFSLGFGPVLYSRMDSRGTRWQVAALPFGGYVKFMGDANAASAPDGAAVAGLTEAERRRTMPGAPLWARAATVAAGPLFNFILAIFVFGALVLYRGVPSETLAVDTLTPLPYAEQELRPGDVIQSIAGQDTPGIEDFVAYIDGLPTDPFLDYQVLRDGQELTVTAPFPQPPLIKGLSPKSAAMDIDLAVGDIITAVDGQAIYRFDQLQEIVVNSGGKPLKLDVWRDGETLEFVLSPRRVDLPKRDGGFETKWLIGISGGLFFDAATETPGPFTALWYGAEQSYYVIRSSLSGLYHMAVGAISTCNLSGPIGIAEVSGDLARQGPEEFIWFIAMLSVAVGLINLFPIPVLDGGHLLFHAVEALTRRKPNERTVQVLMAIGGTVILAFMLFAVSNDIFCP